jgi:hypothetical protein
VALLVSSELHLVCLLTAALNLCREDFEYERRFAESRDGLRLDLAAKQNWVLRFAPNTVFRSSIVVCCLRRMNRFMHKKVQVNGWQNALGNAGEDSLPVPHSLPLRSLANSDRRPVRAPWQLRVCGSQCPCL